MGSLYAFLTGPAASSTLLGYVEVRSQCFTEDICASKAHCGSSQAHHYCERVSLERAASRPYCCAAATTTTRAGRTMVPYHLNCYRGPAAIASCRLYLFPILLLLLPG